MKKHVFAIAMTCLALSANVFAQHAMQLQSGMTEAQLQHNKNAMYAANVDTSQGKAKVYRVSGTSMVNYYVFSDGKVYDIQMRYQSSMTEAQLRHNKNAMYAANVDTPQGKAKVYRVSDNMVNYYVFSDGKVYK